MEISTNRDSKKMGIQIDLPKEKIVKNCAISSSEELEVLVSQK